MNIFTVLPFFLPQKLVWSQYYLDSLQIKLFIFFFLGSFCNEGETVQSNADVPVEFFSLVLLYVLYVIFYLKVTPKTNLIG